MGKQSTGGVYQKNTKKDNKRDNPPVIKISSDKAMNIDINEYRCEDCGGKVKIMFICQKCRNRHQEAPKHLKTQSKYKEGEPI